MLATLTSTGLLYLYQLQPARGAPEAAPAASCAAVWPVVQPGLGSDWANLPPRSAADSPGLPAGGLWPVLVLPPSSSFQSTA